jgi:hypothetical protein
MPRFFIYSLFFAAVAWANIGYAFQNSPRSMVTGWTPRETQRSHIILGANPRFEGSKRQQRVDEMQTQAAEEGTDKKGLIIGAAVVAAATIGGVLLAIGSGYDGTMPL